MFLKRFAKICTCVITKRHYTPRRALLYVPGDDPKKLQKAFTLGVDCIAMDCEDGVALNHKALARDTIRAILDKGKPDQKNAKDYDLGVRTNSVHSGLLEEDLRVILGASTSPDTILLPKVQSRSDLQHVT